MTNADIRALILELITDIAPDADPSLAKDKDDIRELFDLDSMDMVNLVAAIHKRTGFAVPDAEASRLFTLGSAVAYLSAALAHASG